MGSDVGAADPTGRASYHRGIFTVEGGGRRIGYSSDQFFFVHQKMTGDASIVARIGGVENTSAFAKGGIMIRESLARDARHAFALVTPQGVVGFHRRTSSGGSTTGTNVIATSAVWLRLVRSGSKFTASRSTNGHTWTTIGSATIAMDRTVYVGLAVSSYNRSARATTRFSNVGIATPLPTGWAGTNVGRAMLPGSAGISGRTFTVSGGGDDLRGTKDAFRFVYRRVSGDLDIIARVGWFGGVNGDSQAGLMIRPDLDSDASYAAVLFTRARGISFQRRSGSGRAPARTMSPGGRTPLWLKLARRGSVVSAFRSANGRTWTRVGREFTLTLPSTFYAGLAVSGDSSTIAATARFNDVSVSARSTAPDPVPLPPANPGTKTPPRVSLISPASSGSYAAPAALNLTANAVDAEGGIARVDFYADAMLVGSDATSPYSVQWTAPAGRYALTAVARAKSGLVGVSEAKTVTVSAAALQTKAVFKASADHGASVVHYVLDIFTAGANPATAKPVATQNLGKPGVVNGECKADIAATIAALPGGSYFATVVAVGRGGTSARAVSSVFAR